jgi:hypothetical protein
LRAAGRRRSSKVDTTQQGVWHSCGGHKCAGSEERFVCIGVDRSQVDVPSDGLATGRSLKGQGTVRRHSAGTNIVDQPNAVTVRRVVEREGTESG